MLHKFHNELIEVRKVEAAMVYWHCTACKADMYRRKLFPAKKGRQMLAKVEFLKINRFSESYGS